MTDLDAVRLASVPREDALVTRLASRFESVGGFIAYGILWVWLVAGGFALAAALGFLSLVAHLGISTPAPPWVIGALCAVFLLAFALACGPFAIWVRRKRGAARRLFRDGVLLDGSLLSVNAYALNGADVTCARVAFLLHGARRVVTLSRGGDDHGFVVGQTVPVLCVDGYAYAVVFSSDGAAIPAAY